MTRKTSMTGIDKTKVFKKKVVDPFYFTSALPSARLSERIPSN